MSSTLSEAPAPGGYAAAAYVAALGYRAVPFGATGGHLCLRPIGETGLVDLGGPYPMFSCAEWGALGAGVAGLEPGPGAPVSLTLVTDPACPLGEGELAGIFPICRKLHDHWLIELTRPLAPSRHHRRKLRQGAAGVRIEARPVRAGDGAALAGLYAHLVERKGIRDARAFARASLVAQAELPGAHAVIAYCNEKIVGYDLYYFYFNRAYAHLSAYAPEGYALAVSYTMMAAAVEYFAPLACVIDLGGAPPGPAGEGMAHFKRGWTEVTAPSWLCGRVLDAAAYARLAPGAGPGGWFPAYRRGEFARGG
jgi:hypothetical protein